MKFFIKNVFSKCDQIRLKLRIWSHLLKRSLMENSIFCAVIILKFGLIIDASNVQWFSLVNPNLKQHNVKYMQNARVN